MGAIPEFSFCESVTGIGPWHIRQIGSAGRKFGGGIDTPSLCDHVCPFGTQGQNGKKGWGGWDLDVEITEHHLEHACKQCVAVYRATKGKSSHKAEDSHKVLPFVGQDKPSKNYWKWLCLTFVLINSIWLELIWQLR